jgi:hypothetical protein
MGKKSRKVARSARRIDASGSIGISFAQGLASMERQDRVSRVYGRKFTEGTETTAAVIEVTQQLTPFGMDQRLVDLAEDWLFYRFVNVQARAFIANPTGDEVTAALLWMPIQIAYEPFANGLTAPTKATMLSLPCYAFGSPFELPCLNLSRRDLLGNSMLKWYQTDPDATDPGWEVQGSVLAAWFEGTGSTSGSLGLLLEYEVEFKGPCDPGQVARRRARRAGGMLLFKQPCETVPEDRQGNDDSRSQGSAFEILPDGKTEVAGSSLMASPVVSQVRPGDRLREALARRARWVS